MKLDIDHSNSRRSPERILAQSSSCVKSMPLAMRSGLRTLSRIAERAHQEQLRGLSGLAASPRKGWYEPFAAPDASRPSESPALAHRRIEVFTREDTRSMLRRLRRSPEWIPGFLQGRGKVPDLYLRVPLLPITQDYNAGLFVLQQHGKVKFCGPLYELQVTPDPEGNDANAIIPDHPIRALPMNMLVHPITDLPVGLMFVYRPASEPARARVPIRYINMEKCPGLRESGWLNRIHRAIDIAVASQAVPPLKVTQDLADLPLRGRKTVGELMFDGKGNGCRTVLRDDEVTTIISKC